MTVLHKWHCLNFNTCAMACPRNLPALHVPCAGQAGARNKTLPGPVSVSLCDLRQGCVLFSWCLFLSPISFGQAKEMGNKLIRFLSLVILSVPLFGIAQTSSPWPLEKSDFVEQMMHTQPEKFSAILSHSTEYRVQIIYTRVDRDSLNHPHLRSYSYRLNPKEYFYPASLVKLPVAALAIEKMNLLHKPGLDIYCRMKTDSAWSCQVAAEKDTTAISGYPSIAHYIKRMLLISDNEAYNRVYEFVGYDHANNRLSEMGYTARIIHRFDFHCDTTANRCTNPITFYNTEGQEIYQQPLAFGKNILHNPLGTVKQGRGYVGLGGKLVRKPKDYSNSNYLNLGDVNDMVVSIMMHEAVPEKKRFLLSEENYRFMQKYMGMFPRESDSPVYSFKKYEDSYKKYCIYGTCHDTIKSDSIRVFNIVGMSYGYLSDCAYIVDIEHGVEFFLSAVIYTNKDGIINDGKYEYNTVGFPFFTDLGKLFYDYERSRTRKVVPDLSRFKF